MWLSAAVLPQAAQFDQEKIINLNSELGFINVNKTAAE